MSRQRGIALITAVLVVAIAAILALGMLNQGGAALERGASQARVLDATLLGQGLEEWAILQLKRDNELGEGVDSRSEPWAAGLPPLPVPGGRVRGLMVDLDGRFNLNTLVRKGQRDPVAYARFSRLLAALKLEPALADAVLDWIDADNLPSPQGAEDLEYLRADPPYRAANRPLSHVAELKRIRGITPEVYARLAPEVAALPEDAGFNINTASVAGLMSLSDGISSDLAQRFWQGGQARYGSITEFYTEAQAAGVLLEGPDAQDLKVSSNFFLAQADFEIDGRSFRFYSLIQRSRGGGRVLQRGQGAFW